MAAAALAAGARVSLDLPGTPVPQSLQTLAVVLAGALLGPTWGTAGVVLYLAAGALGLPVFADGRAGAGVLVGPTAGYLAGFLAAAWLTGAWLRREARQGLGRWVSACLAMVVAHGVILGLGWLRLAAAMPAARAFEVGVAPFLVGGLLKSGLGAAIATWFRPRKSSDPAASERE